MLCYTILYYTIVYYTILYYTILYYTILYYTILCIRVYICIYIHTYPQETTLVDRQYKLPDGKTIRVGAERFLAPDLIYIK